MVAIPVISADDKFHAIIVIIGPKNIERMMASDPVEIDCSKMPLRLANPVILFCYEEETPELLAIINGGNVKAIYDHLNRGRQFRPDKGDHDRGPEKLDKSMSVKPGDLEL